jgi:hypothetical protein
MGHRADMQHWNTLKLQHLHYRSGRLLLRRGVPLVPYWVDPNTFDLLPEFKDDDLGSFPDYGFRRKD